MSPHILSSFLVLLLVSNLSRQALANLTALSDRETVQGQSQLNLLRHVVSESNLPSQLSQQVGGAQVDPSSADGSINDLTDSCLRGRTPEHEDPDDRAVEEGDKHRSNGTLFVKRPLPISAMNDRRVFETLKAIYLAEDQSGLPVTNLLSLETGFRVRVPPNFRPDRTLLLWVPITPLTALTKHSGARLEEARVAEGHTRSNTSILVLTVISTGLSLLLAVWLVVKHGYDIVVQHEFREISTRETVDRICGWTAEEKLLLIIHLSAVTILAAPFALAIIEGTIGPRLSVEVTKGATVFYASSQRGLSEDPNSVLAGAPYVVLKGASVRHLGYGFIAFTGSLLLILFLAIIIFLGVSNKSNDIMLRSRSGWRGFSLWKLYGSLLLFVRPFQYEETNRYLVLVELFDNMIDEAFGVDVERMEKELLLMQRQEMRERAIMRFFGKPNWRQDQMKKRLARESLHEAIRRREPSRHRLLCKARFDKIYCGMPFEQRNFLSCQNMMLTRHLDIE